MFDIALFFRTEIVGISPLELIGVAHLNASVELTLYGPANEIMVCLFDLILYVPSTIFQLYRDRSSWVEPVLSYD